MTRRPIANPNERAPIVGDHEGAAPGFAQMDRSALGAAERSRKPDAIVVAELVRRLSWPSP
jgi:hypothetical protein